MKRLTEFLSDREIYILQHHPSMSYQKIGIELGISQERVRQLKVSAERKIREEKRREQAAIRGLESITLTLQRRQLWLILRALNSLQDPILRKAADQRYKHQEEDPDLKPLKELEKYIKELLYTP